MRRNAILERNENNKIFIVPVVLNYHFVLEAKNLINSHLKKTGKELYLVEKKAFGGIFNLLKFFGTSLKPLPRSLSIMVNQWMY